jgi:hypothetical protein
MSTLILILPLDACNNSLTSTVRSASAVSTYLWKVDAEFGSAGSSGDRFQASNPLVAVNTDTAKPTSFIITQSTSALWRASSCQGE